MLFSVPVAPAPLNPTATTKAKTVELKIDEKDNNGITGYDPWFVEFFWKRYPTNTDATNDTNGTLVARGTDNIQQDIAQLTNGTTYYYRCFYSDTFGNYSAMSSTVSVAYRGATTSDIDPGAVTASRTFYEDPSNLVRNPALNELSLAAAYVTGGTLTALTTTGQPSTDGTSNNYLMATTSGSPTQVKVGTLPDIPVIPGYVYDISGYVGAAVASLGDRILRAEFYTLNSSGVPVFDSALDLPPMYPLPGGPLGVVQIYADVLIPANCTRMALLGYTDDPTCIVHSLIVKRKTVMHESDLYVGPTGSFGTSETTICTASITHGADAKVISIQGSLKNVAGSTKTATIRLRTDGGQIAYRQNIDIRDNELCDIFAVTSISPSDTATTVTLTYEGSAGSNNVSQGNLAVLVIT